MKLTTTLTKWITGAALAGALLFAAPKKAEAQVSFGISVGHPGYYGPAYGYGYRPYYGGYYAPSPVYYGPRPYAYGYGYRPYYRGYYRPYYGYYDYDPGAAIAAGIVGLAAGAIASSAMAPPPRRRSASWIAYCSRKYRSFDPASGTYLARDGQRYYCQ